jgi:hypothetical protein
MGAQQGISGLTAERLSNAEHTARIYGPRPGVHGGTASNPANLFVVDLREHPFGVGAGFPEPAGLMTARRASPFFRGTDYNESDQERLSRAMVDRFGDGAIFHGRYAWGPNFYGSGPTFDIVAPEENPWAVVTYLQALVGAGAERRPNLRVTLDGDAPVSLRALFQSLCDAHDLDACIIAGVLRTAFLSSRDWIKPAVYGERYGLKMDEYRTRVTISNPTDQMLAAYVERGAEGQVAIHSHVGALWGERPERLYDYAPERPELLFDGGLRMKHLYHINHHASRPEEDSTATRLRLYVYATSTVERVME